MAQNDVRLKLLIDLKGKRVVFAEADKKVVDFLFHLLSLPLGTVCKLLKKKSMNGSLENLYASVETLNQTYLQTNLNKDTILNPKVVSFCSSTMLLPCTDPPSFPKMYTCSKNSSLGSYKSNCGNYYSDDPKAICPMCNRLMSRESTYVKPPSGSMNPIYTTTQEDGEYTTSSSEEDEEDEKYEEDEKDEGGYVKGLVTYMVMDDLTVKPMSTISGLTLLNNFNINDLNSLEERSIILDVNKGVELLKASLQSKTVLTDVFLGIILPTPKVSSRGKKKDASISSEKKRKS